MTWLAIYRGCHANYGFGPALVGYPDGRPYMKQPTLTLSMFAHIAWGLAKSADMQQEASMSSAE